MNQNNSHLIAGFFRYHREKLNYSLRGLVGDGKVVDLSSLSAFENNKRMLSKQELSFLFDQIGFDYCTVLNNYAFDQEYTQILEFIIFGDTKQAEKMYLSCVDRGVFSTLGSINFTLLQYFLAGLNSQQILTDDICHKLILYYDIEKQSILKISDSIHARNNGEFVVAIEMLKEAEQMSYNLKLRAFVSHQFGIYYGLLGNYAEATVSLLEAKRKYGEIFGLIPLIQVNLSLGTVYFLTNSYSKAEGVYIEAYQGTLLLKNSSHLLTKCFNSLCWFYFNTNQYNKVNELLSDKPDNLCDSTNTYFVLSWASYKVANFEDAVKYALEGQKKFNNDEYACTVYKYIENAALGKKTGQDALLKKAIEMKNKENSNEFNELLIREIIDIYERRKNYEKAFKYAKKLLNR